MIRSQPDPFAAPDGFADPLAEKPRARRRLLDLGLPLGLTTAVFAVVFSIGAGGGNAQAFLDYPSLICVFGGCAAALLMSYPLKSLLAARGVYRVALQNRSGEAAATVERLVSLAETARRDGLLALEARTAEFDDPFLVLGIQMAVDGAAAPVIEETLRAEMEATSRRHQVGRGIFETLGRYAPAFGMIGTLVGLVMMLGNMNDPNSIGPGMAVALLTTFYGAVFANAVCLPLADKLGFLNRQELAVMEMIVKGIVGIQQGDHPRLIERRLNLYLAPGERTTMRARRLPDVVEA